MHIATVARRRSTASDTSANSTSTVGVVLRSCREKVVHFSRAPFSFFLLSIYLCTVRKRCANGLQYMMCRYSFYRIIHNVSRA